MIQQIKTDLTLIPYLVNKLEDAGLEVGISPNVSTDDYAAIKVDDYYNGLRINPTPKSIDFLIVVDCECNTYVMYMLELKNVNAPSGINKRDIYEKFKNTIEDFIKKRYCSIFLNDRYKYKDIKLYLVSDCYHLSNSFSTYEQFRDLNKKIGKRDSLKVDFSLTFKPFRLKGKILIIEYDFPPNPIVSRIT